MAASNPRNAPIVNTTHPHMATIARPSCRCPHLALSHDRTLRLLPACAPLHCQPVLGRRRLHRVTTTPTHCDCRHPTPRRGACRCARPRAPQSPPARLGHHAFGPHPKSPPPVPRHVARPHLATIIRQRLRPSPAPGHAPRVHETEPEGRTVGWR